MSCFLKNSLLNYNLRDSHQMYGSQINSEFLLIYSKAKTREETVKKLQICCTCRKLFILIFLVASLCIFCAMDVYCVQFFFCIHQKLFRLACFPFLIRMLVTQNNLCVRKITQRSDTTLRSLQSVSQQETFEVFFYYFIDLFILLLLFLFQRRVALRDDIKNSCVALCPPICQLLYMRSDYRKKNLLHDAILVNFLENSRKFTNNRKTPGLSYESQSICRSPKNGLLMLRGINEITAETTQLLQMKRYRLSALLFIRGSIK